MATSLKYASTLSRRVGLGLVVLVAAACDSNAVDVSDGGGDGGSGDGGDGAVVVGGCDAAKLPSQDPCVINDSEGIFVSSSMGSSAGDGTKASPLVSLQAGIAAATPGKKRVYACAETYAEAITLADGVSIFGYFDCANGWKVGSSHAKVQPATSPAATATNITDPTRVEAVDLIGPDFTDNSQSSIGLVASGSPGLTIANATIHAGTGGDGAAGTNAVQLTDSGTAKNGQNSWAAGACAGTILYCAANDLKTNTVGGKGGTNTCTGAAGHNGGNGGTGGAAGEYSSNGSTWTVLSTNPTTAGAAIPATPQTALGGSVGQFSGGLAFGGAGTDGTNGAAGSDGSSGGAVGTFSASGYSPSDGAAGGDGQPGQGGGGAGAFPLNLMSYPPGPAPGGYNGYNGWGESGAGGGAGGCPGLAGTPGKGGGASVGVVALQSGFVLDHVTIETSNGGAGGAAGTSSAPTSGGTAGLGGGVGTPSNGNPDIYTKNAGKGGAGGAAGVSGSGGGGPSIGLAYQGTAPTLTTCTVTPGAGGAGVSQAPASPDGLSQNQYSF